MLVSVKAVNSFSELLECFLGLLLVLFSLFQIVWSRLLCGVVFLFCHFIQGQQSMRCILLWHCFVMQLQIVCKAGGSLLYQINIGWHDVTFAALGAVCTTMENILKTLFCFEDL